MKLQDDFREDSSNGATMAANQTPQQTKGWGMSYEDLRVMKFGTPIKGPLMMTR